MNRTRTSRPEGRGEAWIARKGGTVIEGITAEQEDGLIVADPLWYRDAIIYELHVRSFFDSDNDGIGDFKGLARKLDYLQELGVTALWLLPFYPSPLRDDGYDIASYRSVNPAYGKLADFREFLEEAHRRGLRVITELVINHTSDQHPWFQRARRAPPGSVERDFYVWSDTQARYNEARIIFQDFETSNWTWDPVADAYFWHRFYHHQPDLNFDNPAVVEEVFGALDYWLEMGVDGLRLDAVPYLFEREGTNCENLPETHAFLKRLRAHVDEHFEERMLLAEANQWPEDAARYFGEGDECHMNFHFPIMPRLFMALRMEDRFPIVDILEQTPEIPDNCQWAVFLRNHDELTLEMVTDEERDYMYRVYAHDTTARINLGIRRRLAPLIHNNRRKMELMNSLLFALPGTPVLYYGDEIGMGDNFYLGDRNGVRTPMQWSGDRNAGFSRANPHKLFLPIVIDPEYHYESLNVEAQLENPSSLLWWMRRLIALRKQHRAFGRGELEWLTPRNKRIVSFLRSHEVETILVVANLSRFAQAVELDLDAFSGKVPVELFGRTRFPSIGEAPYLLTLGPHSFYWFELEDAAVRDTEDGAPARVEGAIAVDDLPRIRVRQSWEDALHGWTGARFRRVLGPYLRRQRWFSGKGRDIRSAKLVNLVPVEDASARWFVAVARVEYLAEDDELYCIPLGYSEGEAAQALLARYPFAAICTVEAGETRGLIHDALASTDFARALLEGIAREREFTSDGALLTGISERPSAEIMGDPADPPEVRIGSAEQSNTSVIFGRRWILKLFRRLEPGVNLDREIGGLLSQKRFPHTPGVAGALEFREDRNPPSTVAILQEYIPNQGDAWDLSLDALSLYYERALASSAGEPPPIPHPEKRRAHDAPSDEVHELVDDAYLELMRLLGTRTGELHLALASRDNPPGFEPQPFSTMYQRSLYQSMRNLVGQTFLLLDRQLPTVGAELRVRAERVLDRRNTILERFRRVLAKRLEGARIRGHGDYHLGQVLFTGKDFVIIDFEGEPSRPLSERRLKRSPLRDVAGMVRSFDYVAHVAQAAQRERGLVRSASAGELDPWARFWHHSVSAVFLQGYFETVKDADFLPPDPGDRRMLLEIFLLEKALYELGYELNNRPAWSHIPIEGILRLSDPADSDGGDGRGGGEKGGEGSGDRTGAGSREANGDRQGGGTQAENDPAARQKSVDASRAEAQDDE